MSAQGGLIPKGTVSSSEIINPSSEQAQVHRNRSASGAGTYYGKLSDGTEEIIGGPGAPSGIPFANDTNAAANVVQVTFPGFVSLSDDYTFEARILTTNTGATQLQIAATGLKDVIDQNQDPLSAGALENGSIYLFAYNLTLDKYQLLGLARDRVGRFELGTGANSAKLIGSGSLAGGEESVAAGKDTEANGSFSDSWGLESQSTRFSESARSDGMFSTKGDAQSCVTHYKKTTTTAVQSQLLNSDGNPFNVKESSTVAFKIKCTGTGNDGSSMNAHIEGAVKNNAGTVSIVGVPVKSFYRDGIAIDNNWDIDVQADGTDLVVLVIGDAAITVLWLAELTTTEITYTPS